MSGGFSNIRSSLAGAWEVMLGRPEGLKLLDTSLEGFWRSFMAIFLIAPFALVAFLSQRRLAVDGTETEPLTASTLLLESIALLIDWFAFPLVFALLARPFGLASHYVPFIVTRNWAAVIIAAIVAAAHALHIVGILPSAAAPYVLLVALAVALRFSYIVARITLAVSMAMALPIVALDFLLSLTIWSAFERLF
jgi:hypothetical protein